MKYGLFLGRFQPIHKGHMAVLEEIVADGLTPMLVMGSANISGTDKNPLTWQDRIELLKLIDYTHHVMCVNDYPDDTTWFTTLRGRLKTIGIDKHNSVWYINRKPEDKYNVKYKDVTIIDGHYFDIFEHEGFELKEATFPKKLGLSVSATDIRKNIEEHKHFLDANVYNYIKKHSLL